MNLVFTALLMLCGLSTAIFATTAITKWNAAAMSAAFAASAVLIRPDRLVEPAWTGGIVSFVAAMSVFRPNLRVLAPLCGGALAGMWSAVLETQGLPRPASLLLAGGLAAMSALLAAKRQAFAPESLREEALLAACALGLAVAILPEISTGWHSALVLNRGEQNGTNQIIANWVLVLSASSVVLGGLYSLLRHR